MAIQYAYNSNVAAGTLTLSGGITLNSNSTLDAVRSGGLIDVTTNAITGVGGINIASSASSGGVVRFSVANTYTGGTTINGGTLALAGAGTLGTGKIDISALGNLDVTAAASGSYALAGGQSLTNRGTLTGGLIIQSGANVSGGGTYNGNVTNANGGFLTPGIGGDTNFFKSLTLAGGSTNSFWIGNSAHDMSVVSNSLDYTGSGMPQLKLDLASYTWNSGDQFVLYNNLFSGMSAFNGTNTYFQFQDAFGNTTNLLNNTLFSAITGTGGSSATNLFSVRYDFDNGGGQGNDILLTAIPEPASLNLLLLLGGAYWLRRRLHGTKRRWDL